MTEEGENLEAEIVYPITCGDSRANLIWRKFVCPGINVKCVQVRALCGQTAGLCGCCKGGVLPGQLRRGPRGTASPGQVGGRNPSACAAEENAFKVVGPTGHEEEHRRAALWREGRGEAVTQKVGAGAKREGRPGVCGCLSSARRGVAGLSAVRGGKESGQET